VANRAKLDSVFNTDVSMAEQSEKKEGKSGRAQRRETIFRSYTNKLGYEVARFATAQFSTRADKIQVGICPANRKRPNFCRHQSSRV